MRVASIALCIILAGGLIPTGAATNAAATTACERWNESLNVVGVPHLNGDRGAIEVATADGRRILTRQSLGLGTGTPGDQFGAAVAVIDNLERCNDLVVGAPGVAGTGAVFVLRGSPSGFGHASRIQLPEPRRGDRFGSSLSTGGPYQVWAGAPGRDVAGKADAGSVATFTADPGIPANLLELTQDSPGVPDRAEAGDQFGEVLASESAPDAVIVGVPHEDVGAAVDAGMFIFLWTDSSLVGLTEAWTQNTPDVPGSAEAGDLFGASLSVNGQAWAVGAPGEDVGSTRDAGSVTFLGKGGDQGMLPQYAITQNSPRVPGRAESGDRFGASIVDVGNFCGNNDGRDGFAIGAPGEDVGSKKDAGAVILFDSGLVDDEGGPYFDPVCRSVFLTQGRHAPGNREPGDRFGTQVAATALGDLEVTAPGEDRNHNSIRDAGVIDLIKLPKAKPGKEQTMLGGPKSHARYGQLWAEWRSW